MIASRFQRMVRLLVGSLVILGLVGCRDQQSKALKLLAGKGYSLSVAEFVRAADAGDAQAVRWFVEAGVEPTLSDAQGRTGMSAAVASGRLTVLQALVSVGVALPKDREAANELLRSAVRSRSPEVLRFLLEQRVKPGRSRADARSPLAVAAGLGLQEAVEMLLPHSQGAEQEALYEAAAAGDVAILSLLIVAGADIFQPQPETERTALMLAAAGGHAPAVEMLFTAGSNRWALDAENHSALDLALQRDCKRCVDLLTVEPTEAEREEGAALPTPRAGQARALKGAELLVGMAWDQEVTRLLVFRTRREETLPWVLTSVSADKALFAVPNGDHPLAVEINGVIGKTDWFLSRIVAVEQPAVWWRPQVALRNAVTGHRLAMVAGVPGRSGKVVAVLEFGPAKEILEASVNDAFVLKGTEVRQLVVDSVTPQHVSLHNAKSTDQKWILPVGGGR